MNDPQWKRYSVSGNRFSHLKPCQLSKQTRPIMTAEVMRVHNITSEDYDRLTLDGMQEIYLPDPILNTPQLHTGKGLLMDMESFTIWAGERRNKLIAMLILRSCKSSSWIVCYAIRQEEHPNRICLCEKFESSS